MDIFHTLFGFAKICRPKSKAFEKLVFLHHQTFLDHQLDLPKSAPTSYRWAYNPSNPPLPIYKAVYLWPHKPIYNR